MSRDTIYFDSQVPEGQFAPLCLFLSNKPIENSCHSVAPFLARAQDCVIGTSPKNSWHWWIFCAFGLSIRQKTGPALIKSFQWSYLDLTEKVQVQKNWNFDWKSPKIETYWIRPIAGIASTQGWSVWCYRRNSIQVSYACNYRPLYRINDNRPLPVPFWV